MSKGTIALIGALFVLSVLVIVVISVAVALSGTLREHDATQDVDFIELLWLSLMRTLDPGTMGGDTGSIPFVLAMLAVTLGGIFIISTLIGVIATGIEGRLADLRKGRSVVVEEGHTVILGWSPEVYSVIEQLVAANENKRGHTVVILADRDKVAMEDDIRQRIPQAGGSRIVCRSGSPIDLDELDICSPQTSRSIIVLSPDGPDPDADVIKTLLAITNAPNRRPEPYHVVARIHDPQNLHVARLAARGEAQLILGSDITGRIAAQTCRQPGLSIVYMELLDFGGNEIYFHEEPELAGTDFGAALHAYRDSSLIGIVPSDGAPMLNPPMERPIETGDRLIFVAQDDDTIRRSDAPGEPEYERIAEAAGEPRGPELTLVLGWNRRTAAVLLELDRYVAPGSRLVVAAAGADTRPQVEAVNGALRNHSLSFHNVDTTSRRALDELTVEHPDHVLIMSYSDALDEQRADAHTLITLLHLRDIAERSERGFSIVSEMLDLRNRNLAKATRADDFIVSDKLISLTMSQLAENPRLEAVFAELFDVEGSEIYLKPAGDYVRLDGPVSFHTVVEAARRRGEVAFGYRLIDGAEDPMQSFGVVLNPDKGTPVQLGAEDRIIVLAES
jgi:ion channel POLLUX/CASTOR